MGNKIPMNCYDNSFPCKCSHPGTEHTWLTGPAIPIGVKEGERCEICFWTAGPDVLFCRAYKPDNLRYLEGKLNEKRSAKN